MCSPAAGPPPPSVMALFPIDPSIWSIVWLILQLLGCGAVDHGAVRGDDRVMPGRVLKTPVKGSRRRSRPLPCVLSRMATGRQISIERKREEIDADQ